MYFLLVCRLHIKRILMDFSEVTSSYMFEVTKKTSGQLRRMKLSFSFATFEQVYVYR